MGEPSQFAVDGGRPDPLVGESVDTRLARSPDSMARTALNISPEKRAAIEDLLRKGTGIVRIAQETSSGPATVALIRDQLVEREPELFKRQMLGTLHRLANKTAATIQRGLEGLDSQEIKAGQIPGLSVALGILLDKTQVLAGEPAVSVVEHRVSVDAESLRAMMNEPKRVEAIEADTVQIS
jgi:hypothetical protein